MAMAVMDVGIVRMRVHEPRMGMAVRVRFCGRILGSVLMLVMRIVHVTVLVHERFMHVLVLVSLGEVQCQAHRHERCRDEQLRCRGLAE